MMAQREPTTAAQDHILGADGEFHVTDEPIDLSIYGWEDWISLLVFWALAGVVFYQVFTRYFLNDPAGWTEEIARYLLVAVVFIGAAMSVRNNNHIQVDFVYRLLPPALGRVLSTLVDAMRIAFLGYATWLTWSLMQRIGSSRMAIIDLPIGLVFGAMLFGFAIMCYRSLQVAWENWRRGASVLERPEMAIKETV